MLVRLMQSLGEKPGTGIVVKLAQIAIRKAVTEVIEAVRVAMIAVLAGVAVLATAVQIVAKATAVA
jgi:hypothetical protein